MTSDKIIELVPVHALSSDLILDVVEKARKFVNEQEVKSIFTVMVTKEGKSYLSTHCDGTTKAIDELLVGIEEAHDVLYCMTNDEE